MKLYFSPGACSLSPRIVLNEAGIPFTAEQVDVRKKLTASGADFRAINPKGYVPALELDNGKVLTEGAAIVQYIADLVPASQLAPAAGSFERYQLMEWLNFVATEVHKNFSPLFRPGTSDDAKAAAREAVGNRLTFIAQEMEGKEYLMGTQFTVADAYLFTVLGWCGHVGMSLDDWPVLKAYTARVAARPAVQQSLRDEGLVK